MATVHVAAHSDAARQVNAPHHLLQDVHDARESGDSDEAARALEELCTGLCVRPDEIVANLTTYDELFEEVEGFTGSSSEVRVQTLAIRVVTLFVDYNPRASTHAANRSELIDNLVAIATDVNRLTEELAEEVLKCFEILSAEASHILLARGALSSIIGLMTMAGRLRSIALECTVNLLESATPRSWPDVKRAIPLLVTIIEDRLHSAAATLVGPISTVATATTGRDFQIVIGIATCFAHIFDRIGSRREYISELFNQFATSCMAVALHMLQVAGRFEPHESDVRRASLGVIIAMFFVSPRRTSALLCLTNSGKALESICESLTKALRHVGTHHRDGTHGGAAGVGARGGVVESFGVDPLNGANQTTITISSTGSIRHSAPVQKDPFASLVAADLEASQYLELLVLLLPPAAHGYDASVVLLPMHSWQWVDDTRQRAYLDENLAEATEREYQRQRWIQKFVPFDLPFGLRTTQVFFDRMRHQSHGLVTRPMHRNPIPKGFMLRRIGPQSPGACTCGAIEPASTSAPVARFSNVAQRSQIGSPGSAALSPSRDARSTSQVDAEIGSPPETNLDEDTIVDAVPPIGDAALSTAPATSFSARAKLPAAASRSKGSGSRLASLFRCCCQRKRREKAHGGESEESDEDETEVRQATKLLKALAPIDARERILLTRAALEYDHIISLIKYALPAVTLVIETSVSPRLICLAVIAASRILRLAAASMENKSTVLVGSSGIDRTEQVVLLSTAVGLHAKRLIDCCVPLVDHGNRRAPVAQIGAGSQPSSPTHAAVIAPAAIPPSRVSEWAPLIVQRSVLVSPDMRRQLAPVGTIFLAACSCLRDVAIVLGRKASANCIPRSIQRSLAVVRDHPVSIDEATTASHLVGPSSPAFHCDSDHSVSSGVVRNIAIANTELGEGGNNGAGSPRVTSASPAAPCAVHPTAMELAKCVRDEASLALVALSVELSSSVAADDADLQPQIETESQVSGHPMDPAALAALPPAEFLQYVNGSLAKVILQQWAPPPPVTSPLQPFVSQPPRSPRRPPPPLFPPAVEPDLTVRSTHSASSFGRGVADDNASSDDAYVQRLITATIQRLRSDDMIEFARSGSTKAHMLRDLEDSMERLVSWRVGALDATISMPPLHPSSASPIVGAVASAATFDGSTARETVSVALVERLTRPMALRFVLASEDDLHILAPQYPNLIDTATNRLVQNYLPEFTMIHYPFSTVAQLAKAVARRLSELVGPASSASTAPLVPISPDVSTEPSVDNRRRVSGAPLAAAAFTLPGQIPASDEGSTRSDSHVAATAAGNPAPPVTANDRETTTSQSADTAEARRETPPVTLNVMMFVATPAGLMPLLVHPMGIADALCYALTTGQPTPASLQAAPSAVDLPGSIFPFAASPLPQSLPTSSFSLHGASNPAALAKRIIALLNSQPVIRFAVLTRSCPRASRAPGSCCDSPFGFRSGPTVVSYACSPVHRLSRTMFLAEHTTLRCCLDTLVALSELDERAAGPHESSTDAALSSSRCDNDASGGGPRHVKRLKVWNAALAELHDICPAFAMCVLGDASPRRVFDSALAAAALWTHPTLFSFENRKAVFDTVAIDARWFLVQQALVNSQRSHSAVPSKQRIVVGRSTVLYEGVQALVAVGASPLALEVEFSEEMGTGSGPTAEFFCLMATAFRRSSSPGDWKMWYESTGASSPGAPTAASFAPRGLFPNPVSMHNGAATTDRDEETDAVGTAFEALGRLVGRAIRERRRINIPLHPVLIDAILGRFRFHDAQGEGTHRLRPSTVSVAGGASQQDAGHSGVRPALGDMAEVDPSLVRAMNQLLLMTDEELRGLDLDFTFPGSHVPLMPDGCGMRVDATNVHDFVALVEQFLFGPAFRNAVERITHGIAALINPYALTIFSASEFDFMLRGAQGKIWQSAAALMEDIVADHGFTERSKPVVWLASVVADWDEELQRKFLLFVAGTDSVGEGGLQPKLTIVRRHADGTSPARDRSSANFAETAERVSSMREANDASLPTVNTCFHYLKLPEYSSREVLRSRLLTAVTDGQGSFALS